MAQIPPHPARPAYLTETCNQVEIQQFTRGAGGEMRMTTQVTETWQAGGPLLHSRTQDIATGNTLTYACRYDSLGRLVSRYFEEENRTESWIWTATGDTWLQTCDETHWIRWTPLPGGGWTSHHAEGSTTAEIKREWSETGVLLRETLGSLGPVREFDPYGHLVREASEQEHLRENARESGDETLYRNVYDASGRLAEVYSGPHLIQRNLYATDGRLTEIQYFLGADRPRGLTRYICR